MSALIYWLRGVSGAEKRSSRPFTGNAFPGVERYFYGGNDSTATANVNRVALKPAKRRGMTGVQ